MKKVKKVWKWVKEGAKWVWKLRSYRLVAILIEFRGNIAV